MRYPEAARRPDGEIELREFLREGEQTAMTIRIPSNLHLAAKNEAALRGMSLSAFVRNCLIKELTKA